jgi:hypothetical protein
MPHGHGPEAVPGTWFFHSQIGIIDDSKPRTFQELAQQKSTFLQRTLLYFQHP